MDVEEAAVVVEVGVGEVEEVEGVEAYKLVSLFAAAMKYNSLLNSWVRMIEDRSHHIG